MAKVRIEIEEVNGKLVVDCWNDMNLSQKQIEAMVIDSKTPTIIATLKTLMVGITHIMGAATINQAIRVPSNPKDVN